MKRKIFVFGSNLGGYHGAGSAKHALDFHGAKYGVGVGLWGNSYAIPTKDSNIETLDLDTINDYVDQFIEFARANPEWEFDVVAIGCGLAGFTPDQIAPMFFYAPDNCNLPVEFINILVKKEEEVAHG